jgi:hypothetical protein
LARRTQTEFSEPVGRRQIRLRIHLEDDEVYEVYE